MTYTKILALMLVGLLLGVTAAPTDAHAQRSRHNKSTTESKPPPVLWAQGLDPMSFRLQGQAFYGRAQHYIKNNEKNIVFFFISEENKQAFLDHGKKFETLLPQYNAWDAYGLAFGKTYAAELNIFEVYDDKIYMFYSYATRRAWQQDKDKFIEQADDVYKKMKQEQDARNKGKKKTI